MINKLYGIGIPCIFNKVTGLLCPGCGITRCLFSLVNFKIKEAYYYNQLITIMFIPILVYYIYYIYCYIFNKESIININKVSKYLLLLVIIFGILRNMM